MTRQEFMRQLEAALENASPEERSEILYDYQEHFTIGLSEGKSEEEIASGLGDPKFIGRQYKVEHLIRNAEKNRSAGNIMKAILAAISLSFLNLIFIIPIFFGLLAALIALYAAAISISISGICLFIASVAGSYLPQFFSMPDINPGIPIFISFGLMSGGALFVILDVYISRFFYQLTIRYVSANINAIRR
jgi:uncharacterized membrane protein